jgi:hypothetical protein
VGLDVGGGGSCAGIDFGGTKCWWGGDHCVGSMVHMVVNVRDGEGMMRVVVSQSHAVSHDIGVHHFQGRISTTLFGCTLQIRSSKVVSA